MRQYGYPPGSVRARTGDIVAPEHCEECGATMPLVEEPEQWVFICPAGHMTRTCRDGEWRNQYHEVMD